MKLDDLKKEVVKCIATRQYIGGPHEGTFYCKFYTVSNQKELFYCPYLFDRTVDVSKGEDILSVDIPYRMCVRDLNKKEDLAKKCKEILDSMK